VPVVAFGLNHRSAPLAVLERVSLPPHRLAKVVRDLCDGDVVRGAVVLSTCHRLELYLDADRFHDSFRVARDVLANHTDAGVSVLSDHLVPYFDEEAATHCFEVAAGLDSAVLGEHEILGQVRSGWELAQSEGTASPGLNLLFRRAIETGKRVRTETALGRGTASISYAAIDLATDVLGRLTGRRVVVLGAGDMGSGVAAAALDAGASEVVVANRSDERAAELCGRLGPAARPIGLARLDAELAEAELLVCSTGATEPVVGVEQLSAALAGRAGRPQVVVDVAMPRDVDPAAKALPGVTVLDLDDLRAHTEAGLDDRRAALGEARAIVVEAVDRYVGERSSRVAVPVIAAMRQQAEALRQAELARHLPRLSQLGPREQEAVAALTKALLAKLLHGPTMVLKDAAGSPRGARLAEAAAELFDLEP